MSVLPSTLRRELSAARRIPYAAHVSPHIVKTTFGDYVQVLRLGGASFECADDEQLNTWHERLNVLWRNIASPQVALWAHVIRRREVTASGQGATGFASALDRKYRARLALPHAQRWIRGLRPRASYARVFFEHTRWITELFLLRGAQIIPVRFRQADHPPGSWRNVQAYS